MFHTPRSRYVFAAICLTSVASVLACSNTPDESDDSPLTSTGGAASGGVDGTGAAPAMGTGAMPDSGTGGGMIGGTGGDTAPPRPEGFAELEKLDRGVVVTPATGGGNLISWRLWGFEDQTQGFHVYRDGEKLTNDPVTASTNFHDAGGSQGASYTVTALTSGVEQPPSKAANLWNGGYLEIPTPPPAPGSNVDGDYSYNSGDGSVGDLDGDGQYEVIIKWDPTNAKDNSQSGHTGNVFIDAYQFNGTRMWRLDRSLWHF